MIKLLHAHVLVFDKIHSKTNSKKMSRMLNRLNTGIFSFVYKNSFVYTFSFVAKS